MNITLKEITNKDLFKAYKMHFNGFLPTFSKYKDWFNNPIFCTYPKFKAYLQHKNMFMYFIICDDIPVGQIWIVKNDDMCKLARIFVLKQYQNKGIATQAILQTEQIFSDRQRWWLDTIKEDKNNCHLYEKLGYKQIDKEMKISSRMTIVEYEKSIPNL